MLEADAEGDAMLETETIDVLEIAALIVGVFVDAILLDDVRVEMGDFEL